MEVSREEEFEHQHKDNSKIRHHSPSAHGIEGPSGRCMYMRVKMFVRGNTNNFQRGFSQHAPPAILNYLKKKKGNIVLFHLFPNGILPLVGLGSNEAQHLALGSMLSHMGTRYTQRQVEPKAKCGH